MAKIVTLDAAIGASASSQKPYYLSPEKQLLGLSDPAARKLIFKLWTAHCIGQTGHVYVCRFTVEDRIEEGILERAEQELIIWRGRAQQKKTGMSPLSFSTLNRTDL